MTKDERDIWISMFSTYIIEVGKYKRMTRVDIVREAAKEADYTIEAIRRIKNFNSEGIIDRDFDISKPTI